MPATVDPRYAATALTGMVDRFAYVWLVLEEDFDEADVVENLTTIWFQAIGGVVAPPVGLTGPRPRPASADDAAGGEVGDLGVVHPEHLAQHLGRVLAEQRRRTHRAHRRARGVPRRAADRAGAGLRVVELDEEAARRGGAPTPPPRPWSAPRRR